VPRILNINNYHYRRGGSDVVYFEHAALMEGLGWDNAFFAMHHPSNYETPWSKYFVDEIEFGHSYSFSNKLSMASKVIYSFEAQRKVKAVSEIFHPDVAHLHCIYHHLSPAIIPTLAKAGIPVVMTAHDLKLACPAYKMLNASGICERCKSGSVLNVIKHRCIRDSLAASTVVALESGLHGLLNTYKKYLSQVVVPSRFFIEKLVEWGWPRSKLSYVPNYVDASRFEPRYQAGNYFLYFGRLAPEKGVATLLRAAAASGAKLKVVGTGPEEGSLLRLKEEVRADAEFMGYRSGAELHSLIQNAKAVILPSEWYENAPMSVLESFALGKPVIGASIGGIPEMIEQDHTGWTFESKNVNALAEVMARIDSLDGRRIEQVGRAARKHVETKFNRQAYADAMLGIYAGLKPG
jgi:glycosyltransferase involved in cell wall biosynthesis